MVDRLPGGFFGHFLVGYTIRMRAATSLKNACGNTSKA